MFIVDETLSNLKFKLTRLTHKIPSSSSCIWSLKRAKRNLKRRAYSEDDPWFFMVETARIIFFTNVYFQNVRIFQNKITIIDLKVWSNASIFCINWRRIAYILYTSGLCCRNVVLYNDKHALNVSFMYIIYIYILC